MTVRERSSIGCIREEWLLEGGGAAWWMRGYFMEECLYEGGVAVSWSTDCVGRSGCMRGNYCNKEEWLCKEVLAI